MKEFTVAYVPVGVGTFHMPSAEKAFEDSKRMLQELADHVVCPEKMLLSIDDLDAYLDDLQADLVVFQNLTFANSAFISEVLHHFQNEPLLLWTLREPVIDGTRLRLNSLTGAYSAANTIRQFRKEPFSYVYGSPDEDKVIRSVKAVIEAARVLHEMHHLNLAAIGHTPQGFGFGRALDNDLLQVFGVHQTSIEARELIDLAKGYSEEEVLPYLEETKAHTKGMENLPYENQIGFARLYRAYESFCREHQIGALATRCWPDFFTSFGTPVCTVLAMLNDQGIASACEADVYGALSMWVGMRLKGKAVFFGDPVSLNEEENTITFWHCGTAACSLAREDTGAVIGTHCNRHIGPTLEFGTGASEHATIFRIGRKPDGTFRFLVEGGKALDRPQQFYGTSTVIECTHSAEEIVMRTVKEGWEPHYVVVYDDVREELKRLAEMLNIEVCEY